MDAEERKRILIEARKWIGTPYHHKGRVLGAGVDCGGLIYEVYKKFLPLKPFPTNYAADWALHRGDELYLDFIAEYVLERPVAQSADIVLFQYGRCFSHAGIITESNTVVHAWGRTGHGNVQESPFRFFSDQGKPRKRKFFTVNK
jgi:NlpC/P60 family putative phage cell wall peptidase